LDREAVQRQHRGVATGWGELTRTSASRRRRFERADRDERGDATQNAGHRFRVTGSSPPSPALGTRFKGNEFFGRDRITNAARSRVSSRTARAGRRASRGQPSL
jgi:hypothetical protein